MQIFQHIVNYKLGTLEFWCFPATTTNSDSLDINLGIQQLSSILTQSTQSQSQTPQIKELSTTKLPSLKILVASPGSSVLLTDCYRSGFSQTSQYSIISYNDVENSGTRFTYAYRSYKGYKQTARRRDRDLGQCSERASTEASTYGVGVCHPPCRWMHSPSWKFSGPCSLGIFMKISSHRHDGFVTQSLTSLPFLQVRGRVRLKVLSF